MKSLKLNIYFAGIPKEGSFLKDDYENANTQSELEALVCTWSNKAKATTNSIKKVWYESGSKILNDYLVEESDKVRSLLHQFENL